MMHINKISLNTTHQQGFTLIELMISIVLGLLITAAALQILISSQRSIMSQQSGSDMQSASTFGMETLTRSIRMANFGARGGANKQSPYQMNALTPQGGVVLSNDNTSGAITTSTNQSNSDTTNISNVEQNSDVLTIQRFADSQSFDCKGELVEEGNYIVEKYFLRLETDLAQPNEPRALGLACASTHYPKPEKDATEPPILNGNLNESQIIMPRVDQFKVLYGVNTNSDTTNPSESSITFLPANSIKLNDQRITSIKIALLVRSNNPSPTAPANGDQRFTIFDEDDVKLNSSVNSGGPKYQRQVMQRTIAIRNARG